ncbi:uncharacterized protein V6R79_017908 [Siganus canaliculatus]
MSSNLQMTPAVINEATLLPRWQFTLSKNDKHRRESVKTCRHGMAITLGAVTKKVWGRILGVCTGTRGRGGEADKQSSSTSSSSSSSPDTWPTFTAASHVTVLLREKAPFVSMRQGGREVSGVNHRHQQHTHTQKEREKKDRTSHPWPASSVLTARFSTQTQAHQQ